MVCFSNITNEIFITVMATWFTKTPFQDLKLDTIVGEALNNAVSNTNPIIGATNNQSTNNFNNMNTSPLQTTRNSYSSPSNNSSNNSDYRDLDIPPFLRRNKGE